MVLKKTFYKFSKLILVVGTITACTTPQSFKDGIVQVEKKNFVSAIRLFKDADKESPGKTKIQQALKDAEVAQSNLLVRKAKSTTKSGVQRATRPWERPLPKEKESCPIRCTLRAR